MSKTKLPSFTTWALDFAPQSCLLQSTFSVERIFAPSRYPSWTFLTSDFRLSLKLGDAFDKALITYSTTMLGNGWPMWAVAMDVVITDSKPALDADARLVTEIPPETLTRYAYLVADTWGYRFSEIPAERNGTYSADALRLSDSFIDKFLSPAAGVKAVPGQGSKAPRRR